MTYIKDGYIIQEDEKICRVYKSKSNDYGLLLSFHWGIIPTPEKNLRYFVEKLIDFYKSLIIGKFKESDHGGDASILKRDKDQEIKDKTDFSLDQLIQVPSPVFSDPLFDSGFDFFRMSTKYGFFYLGNGNKSWEDDGKIGLEVSQDLSTPISKLILETSPYKINAKELKPVIAEFSKED